jgi:hypothetical protein
MAARKSRERLGIVEPKAKDDALALALAQGMTRLEAAKHARMGERTVYTKLQDAAFRTLVSEHRDRIVGQTVGKLTTAGAKATATLVDLLDDDSSAIKLQAARTLLELTVRLGSYSELVDRLTALEARVGADNQHLSQWG